MKFGRFILRNDFLGYVVGSNESISALCVLRTNLPKLSWKIVSCSPSLLRQLASHGLKLPEWDDEVVLFIELRWHELSSKSGMIYSTPHWMMGENADDCCGSDDDGVSTTIPIQHHHSCCENTSDKEEMVAPWQEGSSQRSFHYRDVSHVSVSSQSLSYEELCKTVSLIPFSKGVSSLHLNLTRCYEIGAKNISQDDTDSNGTKNETQLPSAYDYIFLADLLLLASQLRFLVVSVSSPASLSALVRGLQHNHHNLNVIKIHWMPSASESISDDHRYAPISIEAMLSSCRRISDVALTGFSSSLSQEHLNQSTNPNRLSIETLQLKQCMLNLHSAMFCNSLLPQLVSLKVVQCGIMKATHEKPLAATPLIHQLRTLNMCDTYLGDTICRNPLKHHSEFKLRYMNLSCAGVTDSAVKLLVNDPNLREYLEVLVLSENDLGKRGGLEGLSNLANLKELELESMVGGLTEENGFVKFLRNPPSSLIRLDLSGSYLSKQSQQALATQCHSIRVLSMAGCHLGNDGIKTLFPIHHRNNENEVSQFQSDSVLEELHLPYNQISNPGAEHLGRCLALGIFPKLKRLYLEFNRFDTVGLAALLDGVERNTSIVVLQSWNHVLCSLPQELENQHELLQAKLGHQLGLNAAGRKELSKTFGIGIKPQEFPMLLHRADRVYGWNGVYFWLSELPHVVIQKRSLSYPCTKAM